MVTALRAPGEEEAAAAGADAVGAPLTDLQHAYWLGEQGAYDLSVPARLCVDWELPELDVTALRRALDACAARHPMLRVRVGDDGTQRVDGAARIPLMVRDVTDRALFESAGPGATGSESADSEPAVLDSAAAEARWRALRAEAVEALPALADGPPLVVSVVRTAGAVRLTLVLRLFVFDAASVGILVRDLARFYRDPDLRLPPPEAEFLDFARREERRAGRARREAEAYWAARVPELPGPPDLPVAAGGQPADSASFRRHTLTLSAERSDRLRDRARVRGLSVNAVLCSAYAAVLAKFSGQDTFTLTVLASRRPATPRHAEVIGNHGTTVALAVPAASGASFGDRTRLLQERLHEAYGHSAVSAVEVLRRLKATNAGAPTLLPVVFASSIGLPSAPAEDQEAATLPGARTLGGALHTPQVWIDHQVYEDEGGIGCTLDVVEDVFPEGFTDAFLATYRQWLDDLTEAHDHWDEPLRPRLPDRLTAARRAANATARHLPARLLHDGFDEQCRLHPARTAVIHGAEQVSYGGLRAAARALAGRLVAAGMRPGDLVAVRAAKSREQIAAVLAVLYAGGAYVPLAPSTPPRRLAKVLDHAGIRHALTDDPDGFARTPDVVTLDLGAMSGELDLRTTSASVELPQSSATPADLAYVIYTSGTTGEPKGVAVEHRAASNTIDDLLDRFRIGPGDRTLQLSSLGFDLSVFDIFGTLAAGGAIVLPPDDGGPPDPAAWTSCVREHGVTVWNSVPALLDMAMHAGGPHGCLDSLRLVMLSGDWVPLHLPAQVRAFAPDAVVAALGGATEAAIWSNVHLAAATPPPGWTSVPYGTPLANQGFHILDHTLEDAPDWVPGDLVITGAGLARGYHRAPEQTAAAFRHHPVTGERMYFTGDRARYRPDGTLEFLGRADTQVKVRGHRIELAEVASAAHGLTGVRTAVADVLGERPDEQRLALFLVCDPAVVCDPAARAALAGKVAETARETLPPYMVPNEVVPLEGLPVTANGKVDRAALRRTAGAAATASRGTGRPPLPGTETVLAGIWEAVLGVAVTERTADFFGLGGTSLLAARMVGRIEAAFGVRPVLSGLFHHPTLAGQARLVEEAEAYSPRCTAVLRDEPGAPRLVLFHPVGGGLLCYRELVGALPGARHVIGVQSPPAGSDETGHADPAADAGGDLHADTDPQADASVTTDAPRDGVTALATRYAAELLAELGPGQAVFAGWSMGGVLALETARLLRGSSVEVTAVVAVDAYVAAEPGGFVHTGPPAARAFLADLHGGTPADGRDADVVPPELAASYRTYLRNYRALLTHRPTPPDGFPLLAVRCADGAADTFPGLLPLSEHWAQLPPGASVSEVPGDHFSVMDPPRRGVLTDLLSPHGPTAEPAIDPTARDERGTT